MSDDYADHASDFSDPLDESFQHNASGIEQSDHSTAEQNESEADSNIDDSVKEERARDMYEESHPDKEQQQQGGREIGFQEANWSVSSHRPHWGPEKLRDNNPLTYWQSDCPDAKKYHIIDLTFRQATIIKQVSMFIDFYQDESYTPKTVVIRGGNSIRDLVDVLTFECPQTVGWVNADISEATETTTTLRETITDRRTG
ncbi:galactose-binding like protein [Backusella circina FSU 941]|nr:galactose-binding like protein [Backusella circina FSU 941]